MTTVCLSSVCLPSYFLSFLPSISSLHRFIPFYLKTRPPKKPIIWYSSLSSSHSISSHPTLRILIEFFKTINSLIHAFDILWKLHSGCLIIFLFSKSSISFTSWKHVILLTKIYFLKVDSSSVIYDISKLRLVPSVNPSFFYIPESLAKVLYLIR